MRSIAEVVLWVLALGVVSCSSEGGEPSGGGQSSGGTAGGSGATSGGASAGGSAGTGIGGIGAAAGGGTGGGPAGSGGGPSPTATCGVEDPKRIFFNDFESGEAFGDDPATQLELRTSSSGGDNFAVLDGSLMGGRPGRVLRGNFWEWKNGDQEQGQAYDPLAESVGVQLKGSKRPGASIRLRDLGVLQVPSADPQNQISGRAEVYVSVWLWFDEGFTYDALQESGEIRSQSIKLFYAFGPNDTMWVSTLEDGYYHHFLNVNQLDWFPGEGKSGPNPEGRWRHLEFYFKSETTPVYYEYGGFSSRPDLLASACPGVQDYVVQFPVIGSNPQRCLSASEALAQNSRDGIYVLRVDGQTIFDLRQMPLNGRFGAFNFPAWHGGGGQAIASAGWAMDDLCVRSEAPQGFLE